MTKKNQKELIKRKRQIKTQWYEAKAAKSEVDLSCNYSIKPDTSPQKISFEKGVVGEACINFNIDLARVHLKSMKITYNLKDFLEKWNIQKAIN